MTFNKVTRTNTTLSNLKKACKARAHTHTSYSIFTIRKTFYVAIVNTDKSLIIVIKKLFMPGDYYKKLCLKLISEEQSKQY